MKVVRGIKYIHKSNIKELNEEDLELFIQCEDVLKRKNFNAYLNYIVVKIDRKNLSVSFIESDDFDTAEEPTVGDAHKVTPEGGCKLTKKKNNPQIYHHKHTFVANNYKGFDVEKSRLRSLEWEEKMKDIDKRKIGYRDYWEECLKNVGMK